MPIILDGTTGITTPGITNTGTFVFQGPVQVPAGSAATASITTAAGANTGIFFPSSSSVAITTAGTQRFVVDSAGNAGLGVTPSAWISSVKALQVGSATTLASGGQGQPLLVFNAWVNSAGDFKYLTSNFSSRYEQLSGQHQWYIAGSGTAGNTVSYTQAMTLDSSGNLGINSTSPGSFGKVVVQVVGTTSPTNLTNVGPSSINLYAASNGSSTSCTTGVFGWNADTGIGSGIGFSRESSSDWGTQIRFYTHPTSTTNIGDITERARFTSNGEFLVNSTGTGSGAVNFVGIENSGQVDYGIVIKNKNTSTDDAIAFFNSSNSRVGYISFTTSATTYNTSSDRRLKDNVANSDDAGSLIDAINIIKHDWKAGGHVRYGVIAQDLHQIAPEAVAVGDPDDVEEFKKPWGVDYSKLVPMLVKEIQSLRARLAAAGI